MTTQNTRSPLSIFTGQQSQPRLVSRSHGVITPNLMDAFDCTPKISVKRLSEFGNLVDPVIYYTFDGATGKIGYAESNQGQISAALMDLDPSVVTQIVNPTSYAPFDGFLNLRGQDQQMKAAFFFYGATIAGNPLTMSLKDAAKRSVDFEAQNSILFPGLAMLYTRVRGASSFTAAPSVPTLATTASGGSLADDQVIYVMITAVTAAGESTPSGEAAIIIPNGGGNDNVVTVTTPAIVSPVTGYNVYASNRSNGEQLVGAASGTSLVITSLPGTSSLRPPLQNTTGAFTTSYDKVLSGSPLEVTLDQVAFKHPQNGLFYAMVKRDGVIVATLDNPATAGLWYFKADGTKFYVDETATDHVYELFTLYQP